MIFDKTIFHPQGGGQPSDEGYFEIGSKRYIVKKLVAPRNPYEEPYTIKHYYKGEGGFLKGVKVIQVVDMEKRLLYARYHSAGHLPHPAKNAPYPQIPYSRELGYWIHFYANEHLPPDSKPLN